MDADDRTFMRELLLRHEKATDAMIRRLDESTRALVRRLDAGTEALRRHTIRMDEDHRKMDDDHQTMHDDHREMLDEFRAQRQALFRMMDRLDEGGSAAGA